MELYLDNSEVMHCGSSNTGQISTDYSRHQSNIDVQRELGVQMYSSIKMAT